MTQLQNIQEHASLVKTKDGDIVATKTMKKLVAKVRELQPNRELITRFNLRSLYNQLVDSDSELSDSMKEIHKISDAKAAVLIRQCKGVQSAGNGRYRL